MIDGLRAGPDRLRDELGFTAALEAAEVSQRRRGHVASPQPTRQAIGDLTSLGR